MYTFEGSAPWRAPSDNCIQIAKFREGEEVSFEIFKFELYKIHPASCVLCFRHMFIDLLGICYQFIHANYAEICLILCTQCYLSKVLFSEYYAVEVIYCLYFGFM